MVICGYDVFMTKQMISEKYEYMYRVTKHHRADKYGTEIMCPECTGSAVVHHFSWSELTCMACKQSVPKHEWHTLHLTPTQMREIERLEANER